MPMKMKGKQNSHTIAVVSLITSIVSILLAAFAAFGKDWDLANPSFPLGVLTLLVTVLIGWQIIQFMFQKDTVSKIIETEMKRARKETLFHKNNTLFITLGQLGLSLFNAGDYAGALQAYFNALANWENEMLTDESSKEGYKIIVSHLKLIEDFLDKSDGAVEVDNTGSIYAFLETAVRIGDKDLINLAKRFVKKSENQKRDR